MDPPGGNPQGKAPPPIIFPLDIPDDQEENYKYELPKRVESSKTEKKKLKETKYDHLISTYMTAQEIFHPRDIDHWDTPELLPHLLHQSQILGISPAGCYLAVSRIKEEKSTRESVDHMKTQLLDIKDRVLLLEESILNLQKKAKEPQNVGDMIHPIRELVAQVTDLKKSNVVVASGMNTLQQMFRSPKTLACILPEGPSTLPYEHIIQESFMARKQTIGRKPLDKPEERKDLSKIKKPLTKLLKMRLTKQQDRTSSRDTSPGSGFESDRSGISSASGAQRKTPSIPNFSPKVTSKDIESIPRRPLKQVEISSVKRDKDIFRSINFLKMQQAGVPIPGIEKSQAVLQYVNIRAVETLIKWLSDHPNVEWDTTRDKMSDNFAKKKGDEAKAIQLYSVATMVDSTEHTILYLMALKDAKAALCD